MQKPWAEEYLAKVIDTALSIYNLEQENKVQRIELEKAKEKAEENDSLKTAFIQNISHEIRTPMNAIMGFSEFLIKPDITEEKRIKFSKIIYNSSAQLLSIITDILTISSLDTNQEIINLQSVCVNDLIEELVQNFKLQADNQNIAILFNKKLNSEDSKILVDCSKFSQIFSNLIKNALKFTSKGLIEIGYKPVDNMLEFFVKDTGVGIKTEQKDKIFERFIQAENEISRRYSGTGLGLSISKGFVNLLGGRIWVESELEKGSTFYFTIPYRQFKNIEKETSNKNTKTKTILVAEDDDINFILFKEILKGTDINLLNSKDGQETIEICKKNTDIQLILMDIKMPILDGYKAAIEIKKFRPELPIIAQSAYVLENERLKFSENAFDDFITKPVNRKKIEELINKWIK